MSDSGRARFEEIYNAYSGVILAYAARRTRDAHEAADVTAETFTVAWRRIGELPPGEEARPWLYGVARKVLANQHRGERRRRALDDHLASEVARVIDAATAGDPTTRSTIARALAALSERDRELLTLVAWDGLERDEIAKILGCSRAALRLRVHRARQRFQALLAESDVKRNVLGGHGSARWAPAHPEQEDI
jgi:RNA polymerase sigma-70 factor (ECF subfamily)